jgi:AcrR family transcriptional regulator
MSIRPTQRRRGRPANTSTDDTIAAVLAAARRLFAAKGYAGTSTREIAAGAGLAHTAIYNHFGSKAQLFTAVFVDVQQLLMEELDRSVAAAPERPALPGALVDATEALRAADPSYVEFLASMYIEVRRDHELHRIFRGGASVFPIVERLRELSAAPGGGPGDGGEPDEEHLWFWIAFALGLAQLSALADAETFDATLDTFRRRFAADRPAPHRSNST